VRIITPETRIATKFKTEQLYHQNVQIRRQKVVELMDENLETEQALAVGRNKMLKRWVKKTAKSPFAVGLHAEDERIMEENKIRSREEKERATILKLQKERAKNEIIASALEDHSFLADLRKERKEILNEERKLQGMSDLCKSDKV
jgi:hypothetical protein